MDKSPKTGRTASGEALPVGKGEALSLLSGEGGRMSERERLRAGSRTEGSVERGRLVKDQQKRIMGHGGASPS